MSAHRIATRKRMGIVLAGVLVATLALAVVIGGPEKVPSASAVQVVTHIDENSSVDEILEFAESSPQRWSEIEVRGRAGVQGRLEPFHTVVRKPDQYVSEEGARVFHRNGDERWTLDTARKEMVVEPSQPKPSPAGQAELERRMAGHRANDPTLMRDGDVAVETPVNDLINPSYYVRKELRYTAQSVEKAEVTTLAGRRALHLIVRFPAELAKEDHVDVFVDIESGILLGMVIEPLPGNDRYEAYLDEVQIGSVSDSSAFDRTTPAGFSVVQAARP